MATKCSIIRHIPLDHEIETVDDLIEALNDATHNRHSGYAPYYWM